MQRILPLLLLWLCSHTVALAKGGDEPVGPPAKTKAVSRYRAFMPAQQVVSQQFLQQAQMQIGSLQHLSHNEAFSPSAEFLAERAVSAATGSARDTAKAVFDRVLSGGYILDGDVQNAPPLQPLKLPIGIKKHFGQNNIVYFLCRCQCPH